jgi:hypothetical protein
MLSCDEDARAYCAAHRTCAYYFNLLYTLICVTKILESIPDVVSSCLVVFRTSTVMVL